MCIRDSWCVGHLVEMVYPEVYDEKYKKWKLEDLIKHFVEHSLSMGIISIRAIYRSIYEQVFKVLEIENLKMEREFLFVEKRGETAKLQQTFKRFITKDYNV